MAIHLTREQNTVFIHLRKSLSAVQYVRMSEDPLTQGLATKILNNLRLEQIDQIILKMEAQKGKEHSDILPNLIRFYIQLLNEQINYYSDPQQKKLQNSQNGAKHSNNNQDLKAQQIFDKRKVSTNKSAAEGPNFLKDIWKQAINLIKIGPRAQLG